MNENSTTTEYTKFKENIEYTVIMPGEYNSNGVPLDTSDQCKNFVLISALLAILLALSTIIVSLADEIRSALSTRSIVGNVDFRI